MYAIQPWPLAAGGGEKEPSSIVTGVLGVNNRSVFLHSLAPALALAPALVRREEEQEQEQEQEQEKSSG
jgi:hypothetical protein